MKRFSDFEVNRRSPRTEAQIPGSQGVLPKPLVGKRK
jgi:hypothetical protein